MINDQDQGSESFEGDGSARLGSDSAMMDGARARPARSCVGGGEQEFGHDATLGFQGSFPLPSALPHPFLADPTTSLRSEGSLPFLSLSSTFPHPCIADRNMTVPSRVSFNLSPAFPQPCIADRTVTLPSAGSFNLSSAFPQPCVLDRSMTLLSGERLSFSTTWWHLMPRQLQSRGNHTFPPP